MPFVTVDPVAAVDVSDRRGPGNDLVYPHCRCGAFRFLNATCVMEFEFLLVTLYRIFESEKCCKNFYRNVPSCGDYVLSL